MATTAALQLAEERGFDLVEVATEAKPPVCKLLDFDKLRYERKKNIEKARKKIKKQELKEIRLSPNTSDNDLQVKIKQARKFIEAGDKVKITIQFRGREITHPERGQQILRQARSGLSDIAVEDVAASLERKKLCVILKPATSAELS